MGELKIWTAGHSKHELATLISLLRGQGIEAVADIRSQPFSRYNPQFNRETLRSAVQAAGIEYVFLGRELGGRPPEREFYDSEGQVRYSALARTGRFHSGLQRLLAAAADHRVAMLCSEENPVRCHRRLLVGRVLVSQGVAVAHIRGDGSVTDEQELGPLPPAPGQGVLFGPDQPHLQ